MLSELHEAFPQLASDLLLVREEMRSVATDADRRVREPLEHLLTTTGRLFRPSLALIAAYLTAGPVSGPAPAGVVSAAAAVEFLHVATLYHDDVMDEASTRRGVPTLNSRFGNGTAILSGDYLLACCMQVVSGLGGQAAETIARTLRAMCAGQVIETADQFATDRTEEAYLAAISGKTASLLGASASLGALVAGAPAASCQALSAYARHLGMAFQIWDDIRDIRASSVTTGKEAGKDLANGVYTLPVIYGMRAVPRELSQLLADLKSGLRVEQKIRDLLERSGALSQAVSAGEEHVRQAFAAVEALPSEWSTADVAERVTVIARALIPEFDCLCNGGQEAGAGARDAAATPLVRAS